MGMNWKYLSEFRVMVRDGVESKKCKGPFQGRAEQLLGDKHQREKIKDLLKCWKCKAVVTVLNEIMFVLVNGFSRDEVKTKDFKEGKWPVVGRGGFDPQLSEGNSSKEATKLVEFEYPKFHRLLVNLI